MLTFSKALTAGEHRSGVAVHVDTQTTLRNFTPSNAVRIGFDNGYTVSIVWGSGRYATVKDHRGEGGLDNTAVAHTVEVAVMDASGKFLPFKGGDIVKGYCNVATLLQILNWAAAQSVPDPLANSNS